MFIDLHLPEIRIQTQDYCIFICQLGPGNGYSNAPPDVSVFAIKAFQLLPAFDFELLQVSSRSLISFFEEKHFNKDMAEYRNRSFSFATRKIRVEAHSSFREYIKKLQFFLYLRV